MSNAANRTIFIRDNLEVMRGINSAAVDLIYLDPLFNSKRMFEASIGSQAAGASFKDACPGRRQGGVGSPRSRTSTRP